MSIPTLLLFENGKLVRQAVGARPKSGVAGAAGLKLNKKGKALTVETYRQGLAFCAYI